jgi:hypothetical protein
MLAHTSLPSHCKFAAANILSIISLATMTQLEDEEVLITREYVSRTPPPSESEDDIAHVLNMHRYNAWDIFKRMFIVLQIATIPAIIFGWSYDDEIIKSVPVVLFATSAALAAVSGGLGILANGVLIAMDGAIFGGGDTYVTRVSILTFQFCSATFILSQCYGFFIIYLISGRYMVNTITFMVGFPVVMAPITALAAACDVYRWCSRSCARRSRVRVRSMMAAA